MQWRDAKALTLLQDPSVVVEAFNAGLSCALWQHPWPRDGEAVGVEVDVLDEGEILLPIVERVRRLACIAAVAHMARFLGPHVPFRKTDPASRQ